MGREDVHSASDFLVAKELFTSNLACAGFITPRSGVARSLRCTFDNPFR